MKQKRFERPIQVIAGLMLVGLMVFITGPLMAAIVGTGVCAANVDIGGTVTTEKVEAAVPGLNKPTVSQKITLIKPSATPLDTLFREHATTVPISSFKTEYYSVKSRSLTDLTTEAFTVNGEQPSASIKVANIDIWSIDDTVMAVGLDPAGFVGQALVMLVYGIDADTKTLKAMPLNSNKMGTGANQSKQIFATNIPANTKLVRMGNAKAETDAQTSPFAVLPTKDYNYAQIFMAQVEESIYQRMTEKEVNWDFTDFERMNLEDLRARMEYSYLFGARAKVFDPVDRDDKHTCGGILNSITKKLEYGTGGTDRTISDKNYVGWTKSLFVGNSGADSRYLFASADLMESLHLVDILRKQLDAKSTEVKLGITFKMIETNFGIIYLKHHPLLDLCGWEGKGFALDVTQLEKHVFKPSAVRELELKKSGQKLADATVIDEASCPVLRYGDAHAIIAPKL